jgi:cysteinyl-tRNA synthetase
MHTGLLRVDGAKMSKSAGNFTTIRDLRNAWDHRTVRYAFLSHHYRSSMELSTELFESAQATRRRIESLYRRAAPDASSSETLARELTAAREAFFGHLDNDLDTPGALAVLFNLVRTLNRHEAGVGSDVRAFLEEVNSLFGAFDLRPVADTDDQRIEDLVQRRVELRAARRFAEADAIRDQLASTGIVIEDTATGTRWWHDTGGRDD